MANCEADPGGNEWGGLVPTELRQGSIIPRTVASRFHPGIGENELLVVATHDCDCVQPAHVESTFELMLANVREQADGRYTSAKHTRILHMPYGHGDQRVAVEIVARPKIAISKDEMQGVSPDASYVLAERDKRTLSVWLRSRYSRTALPGELVERLRAVRGTIEDAAKSAAYALHGFYVSYDPRTEVGPDDLYELAVFVVYNTEIQGSEEIAKAAALKLQRRFELKFQRRDVEEGPIRWNGIYLAYCEAIADTEFTFSDLLTTQQIQLEYLSLRQDPQGSVAP